MLDLLNQLLNVDGYIPHGYCISWSKPLVSTFVISDVVIFLSYFSMPVAIGYFARKRRDFPYRWLLWMFAAFIMACGTTHLMGAVVLWQPLYGVDAVLKAFTAVISVATAFILWPLIPHALKIPSPDQLRHANQELQNEIAMRKDVEEALRIAKASVEFSLNRERMIAAAIVDSSEDAIIGKTLEGIVTTWNRGAENVFGFKAYEIIGRSIREIIPAERMGEEEMVISAIKRGEAIKHFETKRIHKDGHLIDVSVTVSPIMDEEGQIFGASKIARDITEQKRAEAIIIESRQLLETIIDTVPMRIFWKNREQVYLGCNRTFAMDAGKSHPRDLVGKDDDDMAWSNRADLYRADDRSVIESGIAKPFYEEMLTTADGQTTWIRTSKVPLKNRNNETIGVLGVYEDIAEHKKAQAELEQYRSSLEELVQQRTAELQQIHGRLLDTQFAMDSVGIGILWIDFVTGRFTYANKILAEMLGYSSEAMLALSVPDIDPGVDFARFKLIAEDIRQQGQLQFETTNLTKDGMTIPVEVTAYYLSAKEDTPARIIVFQRDITNRKEQELALIQAKKAAEAANLSKSSFLANMSHEIRTPMNGIIGMAHILRREGVSPEQAKRLDIIDVSAQHLLSVINDILDLSKIEAGKFTMEETPFVVSSLLSNVASILAERAQAKGIRLLIETAHLPYHLVGDPTRLQQALLNYATNAVKFTEQGSITLRTLLQEETADAVRLRFEVQDTGIGIDPEALSRLFSAFEQADNSMTRKYGGTGLGLAITRRLAELMGGEAGVETTLKVGSTFWFTVQLKKAGEMPATLVATETNVEAEIKQRYAGQRILVADDEPINVEITRFQLKAVDLLVDTAEDGAEAVALARKNSYAVIFMDMQMPKLNGLEATRQIRQLPAYRDTPVIAMTANAFAEDKLLCVQAGMNDFLVKPFNPNELFVILLKWLDQQHG